METIIVKNLYKNFPSFFKSKSNKHVLKDINFNVKEGEIFCIVGQNGAGKTTLIKILCGLIFPTLGEVYVDGYDIKRDERKLKSNIGLVTGHERSFYWRLTGRQNLEFFARLYNLSNSELKRKIKYLSDLLGIKDELDKHFQKCSTGFKQRIAIARALLQNPKVIFMDEPSRSLDPIASKKLRVFIRERLSREAEKTVFCATHDLNEAEFLADRIALIDKGKILACGGVEELKNTTGLETLEAVFNFYVNDNHSSLTTDDSSYANE